ncbi:hypothetical protein PVAP13_1KG286731 [Panicum virgatum]|uniref:Uncharacterized protein n=1 Tax=Panicum virgatum TaxID=38727 RepID=A0A8T0X696_PANVG|nr:hypothetical protein PVAP13_1KG286731 [Panicum virgatum]
MLSKPSFGMLLSHNNNNNNNNIAFFPKQVGVGHVVITRCEEKIDQLCISLPLSCKALGLREPCTITLKTPTSSTAEKREEAAPQSTLPCGATAPRKLCTGCRTVGLLQQQFHIQFRSRDQYFFQATQFLNYEHCWTLVAKTREKLLNYMLFLRVTPTLPNTFINFAVPDRAFGTYVCFVICNLYVVLARSPY